MSRAHFLDSMRSVDRIALLVLLFEKLLQSVDVHSFLSQSFQIFEKYVNLPLEALILLFEVVKTNLLI